MDSLKQENKHQTGAVDIFFNFLRLGIISFGGPAAHIAIMEEEFVRRKKWLTKEEFMTLLGTVNLIPGPNSTELAIHIGRRQLGMKGQILAGLGFIMPAMVLVWAIAAIYSDIHKLEAMHKIMNGVYPILFAIILNALKSLIPSTIQVGRHLILVLSGVMLYLLGLSEISTLLVCGALEMIFGTAAIRKSVTSGIILLSSVILFQMATFFQWFTVAKTFVPLSSVFELGHPSSLNIFTYFLKIGSIIYGSGYVLLTYLQDDLVFRAHWLTSKDLLDAISIGQFTPGPVFTTATFLGYRLNGHVGAFVATLGIFLPSFILVTLSDQVLNFVKESPSARSFLKGVNLASMSLLAVVLIKLVPTALDSRLGLIAMIISFTLLQIRIPSAILVIAGSMFGYFYL